MGDISLDAVLGLTALGLGADQAAIDLAPNQLASEDVCAMALRHGVVGLMLSGLEAPGAPVVSNDLRLTLEDHFRRQTLACLRQQAVLKKAITSLEGFDIRATLLKGPSLSVVAYGNSCQRPAGDLDFLVSENDVDRAERALAEIGFPRVMPLTTMRQGPLRLYQKLYKHYQLINSEGSLIELHWRLLNEPVLPDTFGNGFTVNVALNRQEIRTLPNEENVLYLCLHGTLHRWERLIWLADVIALFKRGLVDVDRLRSLAREHGLCRVLGCTAVLARQWLVAIPELQPFECHATEKLNKSCENALCFDRARTNPTFNQSWQELSHRFALHQGWPYRFQTATRFLISEGMLNRLAGSRGPMWVVGAKALALTPVRALSARTFAQSAPNTGPSDQR